MTPVNQEAVRLFADRGHGLSKVQLDAMRWLEDHYPQGGAPPRTPATWRALARMGMVEPAAGGGYRLTDFGEGVLARRRGEGR